MPFLFGAFYSEPKEEYEAFAGRSAPDSTLHRPA